MAVQTIGMCFCGQACLWTALPVVQAAEGAVPDISAGEKPPKRRCLFGLFSPQGWTWESELESGPLPNVLGWMGLQWVVWGWFQSNWPIWSELKCDKEKGLLCCLAPGCVEEPTMWLACLIFLAYSCYLMDHVHCNKDYKYWGVLAPPPGNCNLLIQVLSISKQATEYHELYRWKSST